MRYSYEYKLECVELYRKGQWPETPDGVSQERFRHNIRDWARMEASCGDEVLKHKNFNMRDSRRKSSNHQGSPRKRISAKIPFKINGNV